MSLFRKRSKPPKPQEPEFTISWHEPASAWMLTRWGVHIVCGAFSAHPVRSPIQAIRCATEAEAIERMNAWINAKRTDYDEHGQAIEPKD